MINSRYNSDPEFFHELYKAVEAQVEARLACARTKRDQQPVVAYQQLRSYTYVPARETRINSWEK